MLWLRFDMRFYFVIDLRVFLCEREIWEKYLLFKKQRKLMIQILLFSFFSHFLKTFSHLKTLFSLFSCFQNMKGQEEWKLNYSFKWLKKERDILFGWFEIADLGFCYWLIVSLIDWLVCMLGWIEFSLFTLLIFQFIIQSIIQQE